MTTAVGVLDVAGPDRDRHASVWRLRSISFEIVAEGMVASAGPGETPWRAVLAVEGVDTSDGRFIEPDGLDWRDLPLSLGYQDTIPDGHNGHAGAVMSGRMDEIMRDDQHFIRAEGAFTADAEGQKAAAAVAAQKVRGVSVDVAAVETREELNIDSTTGEVLSARLVLVKGTIMGAIVTPHQAFEQATIETTGPMVPMMAMAASAGDPLPPVDAGGKIVLSRFAQPLLSGPTPLTVLPPDSYGVREVFGHVALWGQCHIGYQHTCKTAQPSASGYAYFHVGAIELDDGTDLPVGRLTVGGNHAGMRLNADQARKWYDDMTMVAAFIRCGEDEYGIWAHGILRFDITDDEIMLIKAGVPSVDCRTCNGNLDLVGVHQVSTPGFPIPRSLVASAEIVDGEVVALIASGVPRDLRCEDDRGEVADRLALLEDSYDARGEEIASLIEEVASLRSTVNALARFSSAPISLR